MLKLSKKYARKFASVSNRRIMRYSTPLFGSQNHTQFCARSRSQVSAEEQAQLKEAGISVVIMFTLNTVDTQDDNIVVALNSVAEMLKMSPYYAKDPAKYANYYKELHDKVRDLSPQANGGYSVKDTNVVSYQSIYQLSGNGSRSGKTFAIALGTATELLNGTSKWVMRDGNPAMRFGKNPSNLDGWILVGDPLYLGIL